MPVEYPEDLATMFDPSEFGVPATYVPPGGGASVAVVAIVSRETATADLAGAGRFAAPATVAKVRASELAAPARGGTLDFGTGAFKVARVDQDVAGAVWTLILEKQA